MAEIREYVDEAVKAISDKKGLDIKIIDITSLSPISDYFVVASGSNSNQLHAMCDEVSEKLSKMNIHVKQVEGYQSANWILMDYGDFIVHLFTTEARDFYNLERIWKDAKIETVDAN